MPEPIGDLPSALVPLIRRGARLFAPPNARALGVVPRPTIELCRAALAAPIGAPPIASLVGPAGSVVVIVSDATRDEPRVEMFAAVRDALAHLSDARITLMIASGTHAPRPAETALPRELLDRHPVLVHDGQDLAACVELGTTAEGTRVRVHRALVEADLVVSLGRVRPHYFAGFSGGAKGVFPGCGYGLDIRQNHQLKADSSARLGRLDDNRCRLDMEAAAALLPTPTYLLNVVADCDHGAVDAVAGHLVAAHREAARRAERWFAVTAPRAPIVVTSDRPPVTSSLYQASKLLPPAGAVLEAGGTVVLVADCAEGTGPLDVVNRGIYELGVRHALPRDPVVRLVSDLPDAIARTTYARSAASIDAALEEAGRPPDAPLEDVVVLWRAGEMIVRAEPRSSSDGSG